MNEKRRIELITRLFARLIESGLGAEGVVYALTDGADPIDHAFVSARRDYRLRHPHAPRETDLLPREVSRISELPAAPAM